LEGVQRVRLDKNAFKFTFQKIHFEVCVGYNALNGGRAEKQKENLYKMLSGYDDGGVWKEMSSSLAQTSLEFLQWRPEIVRRAIKLTKYWNKQHKEFKLPSCAWEIIVCEVYRVHVSGNTETVVYEVDIRDGAPILFFKVLHLLAKLPREPKIIRFSEIIDSTKFAKYSTDSKRPLIVVDPVNPYNDVVENFRNWKGLCERAAMDMINLTNGNSPIAAVFPELQKNRHTVTYQEKVHICWDKTNQRMALGITLIFGFIIFIYRMSLPSTNNFRELQ